MNPALPLLLLLSLVPLVFRRREGTVAWAVVALAGVALLSPALVVSDGIPSPSATLGRVAPWQGQVAEGPGNPGLVDMTFQVEPWLLFLRGELRAGRLPFWNPYQSSGAPYWGNGSSAPLYPLHLLFALLPIELGFVLLPWLRIALGGLGAYWLARELGVGKEGAHLAAVLYPLSGRLVSFLLFPMANALCLVPWIFLCVERMVGGDARAKTGAWRGLAVLVGLQLIAGHPETPVFTALATGIYLLFRAPLPRRAPLPGHGEWAASVALWGRYLGAWAVGALLSGVAIVPLAVTLFETERWQEWAPGEPNSLPLIASLLLRFLLPDAFGHGVGGGYWGPLPFTPTTVYAGALTLPLVAAGLARAREDRRWRALSVTLLLSLAASYHVPGFRELLLALPVIRKGLHHYLLLAVALGLALFAGAGLERWRAGRGRGLVAGCAFVTLGLVGGWLAFAGQWREHGVSGAQGAWTAWLLGLGGLLAASLLLSPTWRRRLSPLVLLLTVGDLAWANGRSNPALSARDLYPQTGAISFLAGRSERIAGLDHTLRPNAAMVYRLYDIRGDDSLKLRRYEAIYSAHLGGGHPTFFEPVIHWQSPWLDRLGVRWVMAPPGAEAPAGGWTRVYEGADATVFERPGWQPLVRWEGRGRQEEGGEKAPEVLRREPGRWEVAWETPVRRRILVAATWDQGWRARVDGEPAPIELVDGVLMGIEVGPGAGRLVLRHRPAGLGWGLVASLLGLALLGMPWMRARSLRGRNGRRAPAARPSRNAPGASSKLSRFAEPGGSVRRGSGDPPNVLGGAAPGALRQVGFP